MKTRKPPSKGRKSDGPTGVHFKRALESLNMWAKLGLRLEVVFWSEACRTIHPGSVVNCRLPEEDGDSSDYEFVAHSGMRLPLDPQDWHRVRVLGHLPFCTVMITTNSLRENRGFTIRPVVTTEEAGERMALAEEHLSDWAKRRKPVLVNIQLGSFDLHFSAGIVVSKEGEFGYKSTRGGLFCMASPHKCDGTRVDKISGYTSVQMTDNKTGASFVVTDCVDHPEDLFAGFPLVSKHKQ